VVIEPGLEARVEHIVTIADTASALGSGDVEVLGTPKIVALCEQAAVDAVDVGPDQTTVGVWIEVDHLAPTAVGRQIVAHAVLKAVDGRKLTFGVEASDPAGAIARGSHIRLVVDRARFMQSATERT
jgi:fluoroacetyl-CoA thioesterase